MLGYKPNTKFQNLRYEKSISIRLKCMEICFLFNFADFSLIEIDFSYRRFWNFVLGLYPSMWYSISLRSFVNRTKWPSETRLFQFANLSQTGTAVYIVIRTYQGNIICPKLSDNLFQNGDSKEMYN